jgi:hypothetical protein
VLLAGFGLVGALIHSQLDPHLGWNRQSLVLVGGLAAAFVVVTGLAEALRIPYLRRRGGPPSHLRMFPLALVAAVALVAVSRAFELQPGLIFGITCGLALGGELNDLAEGRSIAVASVGLLVVAVGSWLLWTPVADAAGGPDPGTGTLFLDAALSTLWVTGLQAVIFGLLPLRFLYGEKVVKWSPVCWIAIEGAALFLFVHAVARPGGASEGHASSATIWSMFGLLGLFTLGALAVWAWFRFVAPALSWPRPENRPAEPGRTLAVTSSSPDEDSATAHGTTNPLLRVRGPGGDRTHDLAIMSRLLLPLSYRPG